MDNGMLNTSSAGRTGRAPIAELVRAGGRVLLGSRVVCGETGNLHLDGLFLEPLWWEFADYAWECNGCGGTHCSECVYTTDGETITVYECGRWRLHG